MTFKEKLIEMDACKEAVEWVGDRDFQSAWNECERGDWMLWLAQRSGVDIRPLTLAKARCAKLVFHLMKDKRSRNAVEVAEQYGLGNASSEELYDAASDDVAHVADAADATHAAFYAAHAAYATDDVADSPVYAVYAAYAAHAAAAAHAHAADAAYAAAAYAADDAADAAHTAVYAVYAAAASAYAASAADDAAYTVVYAVYADARKDALKKCADICREVLTNHLIEENI